MEVTKSCLSFWSVIMASSPSAAFSGNVVRDTVVVDEDICWKAARIRRLVHSSSAVRSTMPITITGALCLLGLPPKEAKSRKYRYDVKAKEEYLRDNEPSNANVRHLGKKDRA